MQQPKPTQLPIAAQFSAKPPKQQSLTRDPNPAQLIPENVRPKGMKLLPKASY